MPREYTRRSEDERFWEKVEKTDSCWIWTAALNFYGYGMFMVYRSDGSKFAAQAHRVCYEKVVGPIPPGLTLDHLCRVPRCVNPDHLEPVTLAENKRRGESLASRNARKTHCDHGHEFTPENTWVSKEGYRQCRKCNCRRQMETQARKRERESS